jgi:predicted HicB family RNase H-like nuclease
MAEHNEQFDGFTITLVEENTEWLAHFVELPRVSAYGDTASEALQELETAWELLKESYRENDESIPVAPARKQYSGAFNVRVDKRVHKALAVEAAQVGVSLNALVAQKLAASTHASQ